MIPHLVLDGVRYVPYVEPAVPEFTDAAPLFVQTPKKSNTRLFRQEDIIRILRPLYGVPLANRAAKELFREEK